MVHWRSFGRDFKTHLLEVLSSRYRPTTFSGLLNNSGLPSPSRWQRLQPQAVCSVFRSWTAFRHHSGPSGSLMLLAAIGNPLQRLPPCCSPDQSYLLTFKTWIQMSLPRNFAIAIYPGKCLPTVGCAKTQESICLKSSIGQLLMWTSGLRFSEEKTADYSLSSCMWHTQGWNSFQARRRQRGIVQL